MQLEEAVKEVADEITAPRPEGETVVQDIQVLLKSDANPICVRDLKVWKKVIAFEEPPINFKILCFSLIWFHNWLKSLALLCLQLGSRPKPQRFQSNVDHAVM